MKTSCKGCRESAVCPAVQMEDPKIKMSHPDGSVTYESLYDSELMSKEALRVVIQDANIRKRQLELKFRHEVEECRKWKCEANRLQEENQKLMREIHALQDYGQELEKEKNMLKAELYGLRTMWGAVR